jgi:hypothetical protein
VKRTDVLPAAVGQPEVVVVRGEILTRHDDAGFVGRQRMDAGVLEVLEVTEGLARPIHPEQLPAVPVVLRVVDQQPGSGRREAPAPIAEVPWDRPNAGRNRCGLAAEAQRLGVEGLRHQSAFTPEQQVPASRMVRLARDKHGVGIVLEEPRPHRPVERPHEDTGRIRPAATEGEIQKATAVREEEGLVQIRLPRSGAQHGLGLAA